MNLAHFWNSNCGALPQKLPHCWPHRNHFVRSPFKQQLGSHGGGYASRSSSTISLLALSADRCSRPPTFRAPAPAYGRRLLVPVFNWTGGYIGINGGYGWGSSDWSGFGAEPILRRHWSA